MSLHMDFGLETTSGKKDHPLLWLRTKMMQLATNRISWLWSHLNWFLKSLAVFCTWNSAMVQNDRTSLILHKNDAMKREI